MLPDGFEWRPFVDGEPALYLEATQLAYVTNTHAGTWRIGFLAKSTPHYRFMSSQEAAQRYVEAWAAKWEVGIRERVSSRAADRLWQPPSEDVSKAAASRDIMRRRGHNKNWWIKVEAPAPK